MDLAVRPAEPLSAEPMHDAVRTMADVVARTHRIKEVQATLMKIHVHFGTIPGTPKPTLYQPGADLLNVTFRIAPKVRQLEDLSTDDSVRYRYIIEGVNQLGGEVLGEGVGECSSDEERYRWRRAICAEEFDDTPIDRRREKWQRGRDNKNYKIKQVRTNVADVANTCLKIAFKRAKVAMTLNVTAASDVFSQDLEDLADELREQVVTETPSDEPIRPAQRATKPPEPPPVEKRSEPPPPPAPKGRVVKVHDRPNGAAIVELDTGFVCSTRDADVITQARLWADEPESPTITVVTKASADPSKYVPILLHIEA